MNKITILAIPGSLRRHSFNKRVLKAAAGGVQKAGGSITFIDLLDFPLSIYNADDQEQEGFSPHVLKLQSLINRHDGLLIATPSYNGSLSAALKNALDWTSRPNEHYQKSDLYIGKTAAIMSASPGSLGGVRALGHLRDVLTSLKVHVLPTEVAVTFAEERFHANDEDIIDLEIKQSLEHLGQSLVEMIRKTQPRQAVVENCRNNHQALRITE